ncbi:MAG: hypothetical protein LUD68_05360, partial [Rikenellaceae bacterium]|nr:hypothetical protein [Rikenellaceae bacterium]
LLPQLFTGHMKHYPPPLSLHCYENTQCILNLRNFLNHVVDYILSLRAIKNSSLVKALEHGKKSVDQYEQGSANAFSEMHLFIKPNLKK